MSTSLHVWRPSSARRVMLDSFVPLPRGVQAAAVLAWPAKDPADVLDYEFDFSRALLGNEGDAAATVAAVVSPAGAGELVLDSIAADGSTAILWLSGGRAGTVYSVQISVTTLNGRSLGRTVLLPVLALAGVVQDSAALTTESGVAITDQNGNPILIGN